MVTYILFAAASADEEALSSVAPSVAGLSCRIEDSRWRNIHLLCALHSMAKLWRWELQPAAGPPSAAMLTVTFRDYPQVTEDFKKMSNKNAQALAGSERKPLAGAKLVKPAADNEMIRVTVVLHRRSASEPVRMAVWNDQHRRT